MPRKILHLDLDAFFCAVEELRDPGLRGKAFAVGGRPESRGVVASCSYAARQFGVHSAMPMAQAVRACPGLLIVSSRHSDYGVVSKKVMEQICQLTPLVEQVSIDEAFMDISDLPEEGRIISEQLQATINRELQLPCSLGVATNKLVAKIATDVGKAARRGTSPPNAITVVPPGEEAAFLASLPTRALWGVGPKTATRLAEIGILTIGQLASQSEALLSSHFGKNGLDLVRHARGIDDSPVITTHSVKSISQETTFDRDVSDGTALRRTLKALSESVGSRLRQEHLSGGTIRLKLRWSNFTTLSRQATLSQPTDQDRVIFETACTLFDQTWTDGRPVRLLGVGASGLGNATRQLSLWDAGLEKEHRLLEAVDELRQRFGDEVIQHASRIEPPKTPLPKREEYRPPSMPATQDRPIPNSYWVIPGRFLAGEYPGALVDVEARGKICRILESGVTCFIDLTEPGESGLHPYEPLLMEEAARMNKKAQYIRMAIQDCGIPTQELMEKIQHTIANALGNGENLYLHCWGGRGRTGTVVGCYLVEQGMAAEQALEQIRRWRQPTPKSYFPSPETNSQIRMVTTWSPI
jgi:DNA polymerase IV